MIFGLGTMAYERQIRLPSHFRVYNTAYVLGDGIDDLLGFVGYERAQAK